MSSNLTDELKEYDNINVENKYKEYEHNLYPRLLGGTQEEFPLCFPNIKYNSIDYIVLYLESLVNWRDALIDSKKITSFIDKKSPTKKFFAFKKILGFDNNSCFDLINQIKICAGRYKLFLTKKIDKYGFRVKVYMPIYSLDRKKYLIIKTLWLINEEEVPIFITAYYDPNYKENAKNEISK